MSFVLSTLTDFLEYFSFSEQEIDGYTLVNLSESMISQLFSLIKTQVQFKKKLCLLKTQIGMEMPEHTNQLIVEGSEIDHFLLFIPHYSLFCLSFFSTSSPKNIDQCHFISVE